MFVCGLSDFLASYGPLCENVAEPNPDVDACFQEMLSRGMVKECEDGNYDISAYATKFPSEFGACRGDEAAGFHAVKEIVDFVLDFVNPKKEKEKTGMNFIVVPNEDVPIPENNYDEEATISGYFVAPTFHSETTGVPNKEINIPVEFKQRRKIMQRKQVHREIFRACSQVMEDDIRRMWIYGLSFEDWLLSVWYFSRSHYVKSEAFNWVQYPKDFVRVLFALAKATPQELGIDPTVSIGPDNEHGKGSYVYQFPATGGPHRFFKTIQAVFLADSRSIVGRTTRVWTAVEVTSADGKHPINPLKTVILKDVWLNQDGSKTEVENLDAIFASVDEYVDTGLEALKQRGDAAATRAQLIEQLVESDARFKHFDQASKGRLCLNLTNHAYRSLFLTKLHSWKGEVSKPIGQNVWRSDHKLAEKWHYKNLRRRSESVNDFSTYQFKADGSEFNGLGKRDIEDRCLCPPRRQSRFIYEEVCTTLRDLDTVGNVVGILCQTMDAMHILFLAGWVHRDISPNNIMAYRSSPDKPWAVKIADLELARPMVDDTREPDPDFTIGTPTSMPVEIARKKHFLVNFYRPHPDEDEEDPSPLKKLFKKLGNRPRITLAMQLDALATRGQDYVDNLKHYDQFYLFWKDELLAEVPSEPCWDKVPKTHSTPVNHTFQHDLESIWWTLLWVVTSRIGNKVSADAYDKYFAYTKSHRWTRWDLFTIGLNRSGYEVVEGDIREVFLDELEYLRMSMYRHYLMRQVFGRLEVPESYSSIQDEFSKALRFIQASQGPWRDITLQKDATNPIVQPDVAKIADETPANAVKRKRESESQENVTADEDQRAPKRDCK